MDYLREIAFWRNDFHRFGQRSTSEGHKRNCPHTRRDVAKRAGFEGDTLMTCETFPESRGLPEDRPEGKKLESSATACKK